MDYPHPLETLKADGTIDLTDAYAVGIGEWDKVAVRYAYGQPAPGADAAAARQAILADAATRDLRFLSDQDPPYHPRADRWANGTDPAAELRRIMRVRRAALDRFGETTITRGTPLALMEEALVPLFLHHRYQVDAAASALGGQYYGYALRGDGEPPRRPVPAAEQKAALEALAATLTSSELVVPSRVLDALAPRPSGYEMHRELFPRYTGLPFDPVTPGLTAADVTLTAVLDPARAARLVSQAAYDATLPSFGDVLDRLTIGDLRGSTGERLRRGSEPGRRPRLRRSADDAGRRCADAAGARDRDLAPAPDRRAPEGRRRPRRRAGRARPAAPERHRALPGAALSADEAGRPADGAARARRSGRRRGGRSAIMRGAR